MEMRGVEIVWSVWEEGEMGWDGIVPKGGFYCAWRSR